VIVDHRQDLNFQFESSQRSKREREGGRDRKEEGEEEEEEEKEEEIERRRRRKKKRRKRRKKRSKREREGGRDRKDEGEEEEEEEKEEKENHGDKDVCKDLIWAPVLDARTESCDQELVETENTLCVAEDGCNLFVCQNSALSGPSRRGTDTLFGFQHLLERLLEALLTID